MTTLIGVDQHWLLFGIMAILAALAIVLEQKFVWASKVTGCIIALVGAMLLANFNIIPTDAPAFDFIWSYIVPLAIPMLLFQADVKKILRESGRMLGIYLLSGLGTIVGGFAAFYLLRNSIPELAKITAMMVGSYTGGSVNFVAMADAFQASSEMTSAAVVADNLLMALYFFVLIAIPSSKFFLKHFKHPIIDELESGEKVDNRAESYWKAKPISLRDIGLVIAVSFGINMISVVLSNLISGLGGENPGVVLDFIIGVFGNKYLLMTTLTMIFATIFSNFFNSLAGAQEIGTYLIYIFFTVIGVPASIPMIIRNAPLLLVFCLIMVLINMIFSFGFGKIFKFGIEEICLASNANIGGPTTAAALAVSKGWNQLIVPTILVGTLGYVIGNYYGLFIGRLLGG